MAAGDERQAWRRVAAIVVTLVLGVAAAWWTLDRVWGGGARSIGRELYQYRPRLQELTAPDVRPERSLVWLGDSTIMGIGRTSYPQRLAEGLRAEGVETRVVAAVGMDFYAYYFLMDRILASEPALLVVLANLARFRPEGLGNRRYNDLSSFLPLRELSRAALLPLGVRGLDPPRLVLAQLLRHDDGTDALFFLEGIRNLWSTGPATHWFGPEQTPRQQRVELLEGLATQLRMHAVPVTRRSPVVRMMAAALRMAQERRVRVLVVACPVPWESMQDVGLWNAERFARWFALLSSVAEEHGARFLDLHDALGRADFEDAAGHYSDVGSVRMAQLLAPVLADELHLGRRP